MLVHEARGCMREPLRQRDVLVFGRGEYFEKCEIGVADIREFGTGDEALNSLQIKAPHIVISDFNMPELDGLGLLRAVRGHPAVRKLPFILITGRGDRELVITAAQAGVNNYLVKPFTEAILRQKMEEVMGKLS